MYYYVRVAALCRSFQVLSILQMVTLSCSWEFPFIHYAIHYFIILTNDVCVAHNLPLWEYQRLETKFNLSGQTRCRLVSPGWPVRDGIGSGNVPSQSRLGESLRQIFRSQIR